MLTASSSTPDGHTFHFYLSNICHSRNAGKAKTFLQA